jgi:hypothetical protein
MTKVIRNISLAAQNLKPNLDRMISIMRAYAFSRREPEAPPQSLIAR